MRSYTFLLLASCVMSHNDGSLVSRTTKVHDCALPELKDGKFVCPDQSVPIHTRRSWEEYEPFDEINGERLDDRWPATPSDPVAAAEHWNVNGIRYSRYQNFRKAGERSPIHIHENTQITCLVQGKVMMFQEGEEPSVHEAPSCIVMRPYVKMSALSLTDKIETELFHVPEDGLDWVVLEPKYHHMQGQWEAMTPAHEEVTVEDEMPNRLGSGESNTIIASPRLGASTNASSKEDCEDRVGNTPCSGENWMCPKTKCMAGLWDFTKRCVSCRRRLSPMDDLLVGTVQN